MHNASFANQKSGANATAGGPAPPAQQQPQPVLTDSDFGFDSSVSLDFATDGGDVLESFDFDSFLHNTDDTNSFGNFDFMNIGMLPYDVRLHI
jgi:hypothetical protein